MSKSIEKVLRNKLDPHDHLPQVRLRPTESVYVSDYQNFQIYTDLNLLGSVELHRWSEQSGRPVIRAEALIVSHSSTEMEIRYAAHLGILAMSTQENRTFISAEHGLSLEDKTTWAWLTEAGLAVTQRPFIARPELNLGKPIYDGMAYAPPVTLRG
jgi:hypothetical protein